ncbi:MAG: UTP--glucose-1-phosphate uridylyltransferase [Caldilineaceae bacterium]|nr:UTP--glucose-1-phosphate uridylyltransferase [Caldilineaceae bacterium]
MRAAGSPDLTVQIFRYYYAQLLAGETGFMPGTSAAPVDLLPDYAALDPSLEQIGRDEFGKCVVIKLNGGLGTGMGMNGPKSLVAVKDGLTFLDIIVRQVLHLRERSGIRLPLVLMNSFNTHEATIEALQAYPDFSQDIPIDFLQHKKLKILKGSLTPAIWPADPEKEWCPPGHGDIYASMLTSGALSKMLEAGYEYAFISNSDNLGAILDERILGYVAANKLPFLMEVAYRTKADRKGGHLARRPDGRLVLREVAQCPPEEMEAFQDIERYRYFNTNNLWVHLPTLDAVLREHSGVLELPLIRNEKPVDPIQPDSPRVYQLETAMGSAISLFEGAQALRVPRSRFIPIKRNNDLLSLWSDVYLLTADNRLVLSPDRQTRPARRPPLVELDDRYYQLIDDLRLRFPFGAPSLLRCTELRIEGDVRFGKGVVMIGKVHLINRDEQPICIADGTVLTGDES